jgi:hypothetical protein
MEALLFVTKKQQKNLVHPGLCRFDAAAPAQTKIVRRFVQKAATS